MTRARPVVRAALLLLAGRLVAAAETAPLPDLRTSADLPATASYRYTLTGRIRPLLFWISRDGVGFATITWRAAGDVRGYELLVGSDPASAPRGINKWGYIAETAAPHAGTVFALMTGTDAGSYEDAAASATQPTPGEFRAIRSSIADGQARWQTTRVPSERQLTIHDLESAVQAVREAASAGRSQSRVIATGTRPGFLTALAELLGGDEENVSRPAPITYAFGQRSYQLRQTRAVRASEQVDGRPVKAVQRDFEIVSPTGERTRFTISSALEGRLAGVPLRISWQPHWWLGLELRLADPARIGS